jgi:hypothetical protein
LERSSEAIWESVWEESEVGGEEKLCERYSNKKGEWNHFQKVLRDPVLVANFGYSLLIDTFELVPVDGIFEGHRKAMLDVFSTFGNFLEDHWGFGADLFPRISDFGFSIYF